MTKILLIFWLSLGVTASATQRALANEQIWIVDSWSCADWAARTRGATPVEHHLVGLINGMSLGSGLDLWGRPTKVDKDQAFYWMDQYCAAHPLDGLVQGAAEFAKERRGAAWIEKFQ